MSVWRIAPTLAVVAAAALLLAGCNGEVRPTIAVGIDSCNACNMIIDSPRQACGYVLGGEFVTFDGPICLLRRYEALRQQGETLPETLYFSGHTDATLHPAEEVVFLITQHLSTPMEDGVLSFADRAAAEMVRSHDDEILTDWDGLLLARGSPDRVLEVSFGPEGMEPEVVQAAKGELLLWKARANELDGDLVISVKGYPDLGSVLLPVSGEEVLFRLKASRPGSGFPVVADTGEPLGMLKVSGTHTVEEEAM